MAIDAETLIDLDLTRNEYDDPTRAQRAVLHLTTHKHFNGGLVSRASVYWHGEHSRSQAVSLTGRGGDFSAKGLPMNPKARATQSAIDKQHAQAFPAEVRESLTSAAKAHYTDGSERI